MSTPASPDGPSPAASRPSTGSGRTAADANESPPDLSDPETRARYIAELRGVARGTRTGGIMLAMLGVVTAALRGTVWPWLPELVPLVLIVTALGLMLLGIVRRTRYHMTRMRGLE